MCSNTQLSKSNFEHLDIPTLLINIWEYNDQSHLNCLVFKPYEQWCIEIARSKWQSEFKSFAFVIAQIQIYNKFVFDFGKISHADKLCLP